MWPVASAALWMVLRVGASMTLGNVEWTGGLLEAARRQRTEIMVRTM